MSRVNRTALLELRKVVAKNTPRVEKKFREARVPHDAAIVFSTAQYYDTLKKLAKK